MVTLLSLAAAATAADDLSIEVQVGRPSHGVVSGVLDADVQQVLDVILDCEATDTWFPDLRNTHAVRDDRCGGSTDLPWPVPDRTWQIDVTPEEEGDGWAVGFAYVTGSGNLSELRGHYVLEPLDDGRTLVTYEAWIDLGFWVPEPLVAWATRRVLPGILGGLEAQARAQSPSAFETVSARSQPLPRLPSPSSGRIPST